MRRRWMFVFWLFLIGVGGVQGRPLAPEQVPEPLRPWIGWALQGSENRACPFLYNQAEDRRCAWPTRLELNLEATQGSFQGLWQVQAETWIVLPGDLHRWPQKVEVDGKPAVVTARQDVPTTLLLPGTHTVSGRFIWDRLPENLVVPRDSGLIALTVNGRSVSVPVFNEQGQLWIEGDEQTREARGEVVNRLELQVFRKLVDEVPLRLLTHLELDVSGEQREIVLTGALLPKFIPLQLDSALPARLEPDGRLRMQVRPGRWQVELTARHPSELGDLPLPTALPKPWPQQEIWAFEPQPHLRIVEIEGVPAVDPRQTNLPENWKSLPAYALQSGSTMVFKQIRRGDPEPEPDALNLRRRMWLDFDGGGYTFSDEITGLMTRDWRLNVLPGVKLGSVTTDGEPQLITRLGESGPAGVEVRRGQVRLSADSRFEGPVSSLSATGWDQDFRSVSAELHLSPGWRLLAATGVDSAPDTWISRWTLLDLFLVLIAALAVARMRGWPRAGVALFALGLLWHEPGAPRYVWLHLLLAIALLRVLPPGRIASIVTAYRHLSLIALALIAMPFMVDQIRFGIYPQLELPWFSPVVSRQGEAQPAPESKAPGGTAVPADVDMEMRDERQEQTLSVESAPTLSEPVSGPAFKRRRLYGDYSGDSASRFNEIDPGAITQTGPGLPLWRWTTVSMSWNGPVLGGQEIHLFLLSPAATMLLNFLRVALLLGLAWALLVNGRRPEHSPTEGQDASPPMLKPLGLLIALAALLVPTAKADFPEQTLLDELKTRLLAPPDCLPECAQIPLLRLRLGETELQQQLEIHAQQDVAVPLPVQEGQWLPSAVNVDGAPAQGLLRTENGGLWLHLAAGTHDVRLSGPLPRREQIQLPLPLKPHRVESEGAGWVVEGIHDDGAPDAQLQLSRMVTSAPDARPILEPRPLPAFLEVRRTLQLGLDWRVSTMVRRLSPADSPIVIEIPLLEAESVITSGLTVKNGKALVSLASGQPAMSWDSVLDQRPNISLKAPETTFWAEVWRLDVSPIWHLESGGIAPAHHQDGRGNWLPEWRPWPGEMVNLTISRPEGIPGNTLTIESSRLEISPGQRATDAMLSLSLRSSQGGQHVIRLPEGAVLLSATIEGRTQPIRQHERLVTLPIRPGQQDLTLAWRDEVGIHGRLVLPEVDLGTVSVNSFISLQLGKDRWVLLTGGPRLGPAVLFWGVLLVIVLLAAGLGRIRWTPLKAWQWGLLLIGLSQIPIIGGLCVVGWLLALGWRARQGQTLDDSRFNVLQLGLGLLSVAALLFLFYAVEQGLLGLPDMQIAGNNSNAYSLNWYQDHGAATLPRPWVFSAPLWTYRLLMLGWALWLAYSLLDWLRWGWVCFATNGLWRPRQRKAPELKANPPEQPDWHA